LDYLQPFRRNSLLKCASQPKIAKKITKTFYFGGSKSFEIVDDESPSPLLVVIDFKSVLNFNRFYVI